VGWDPPQNEEMTNRTAANRYARALLDVGVREKADLQQIERDRLVLLPDLLDAYRERLLDHQKVVRAQVTTATALAPDRAKAIEQKLAQVTGRTVTLDTKIDPTIIGGVVARIGSTVYDGSITRQLEKMKQRLVESV